MKLFTQVIAPYYANPYSVFFCVFGSNNYDAIVPQVSATKKNTERSGIRRRMQLVGVCRHQDIVQPLLGMDGVVQLGGPASIKTLNNQRVDEGFAYPCPSVYLSASAVNKPKGLVTHIKSPLPPVQRTSPSSFPFPLPGNPTQKCWKR